MTTYVLAGGSDTSTPGYIESLSRVLKLLTRGMDEVSVLGCSFSQPKAERRDRFEYFLPYYQHLIPDAKSYVDATEDEFIEQLEEADVVYLRGGSTQRLINTIPDFDSIKHAIENKIVIGSSAGANYLSSYCYSPSADEVLQGSGIIDRAVVVHYGAEEFGNRKFDQSDWHDISGRVREAAGDTETLCLAEGQFSIITKQ